MISPGMPSSTAYSRYTLCTAFQAGPRSSLSANVFIPTPAPTIGFLITKRTAATVSSHRACAEPVGSDWTSVMVRSRSE